MDAKHGMHLRLAPMTGVDGDSVELSFSPYNRVQQIKETLLKQDKTIAGLRGLRADDIDLVQSSGRVLSDGNMLLEYGIDQSTTLTYAVNAPQGLSVDPLEFGMKTIVDKALQGMQKGIIPKLEELSTGGTYRLFGHNCEPVAILKPADEEAYAPRNPHTYVGGSNSPGLVAGVYSTQGAAREVAAFALDGGFAGVPRTCHAHAKHLALNNPHGLAAWKSASLQQFVPSHGHSGDFAPSFYSKNAVHRVAILDVRLVNLDRNEGNLLVVGDTPPSATSPSGLAPIDHGLCLPDMVGATIENIVWMSWPQVHEPLSPDVREYIRAIDTVNDLRLLKDLGISGACARLQWASTRLLQIAAGEEWTLYDIGKVLYRTDLTEASDLEIIVEKATAASAHALSPLNLHAPKLTLSAARSASPTRTFSRVSTPSTRASSPGSSFGSAELSEDSTDRHKVFCALQPDAEWPTQRTALFVEMVDVALTKLCRRQRTLL